MTSNIPVRKVIEPVRKVIADIDESEKRKVVTEKDLNKPKKPHRHVHRDRMKDLKKLSGNFRAERSRSYDRDADKAVGYMQLLVQTKDEQIEKLLQKVTDLQNYNEQFSTENEKLRTEIKNVSEKLDNITKAFYDFQKQPCKKCLEFEKLHEEYENERQLIVKTNRNLTDDVSMMKTLVYRLNVQLERYQELLRKFPETEDDLTEPTIRSPSEDNEVAIKKWGSIKSHTLSPLLNAYEEMIKEKEDLVAQHEREMNRFTGHLKEIISENEKLHAEMDDLQKGRDSWIEEKTRLQAQVEICRTKAEVQTRRADVAKEKLVEILRCYEQKVQGQALDIERLQEAYSRAKGEIVSLRNIQSHPETVVDSLKECQRLFEELKSHHNNEKTKISNNLSECRQHQTEMELTISKLREENSNLKDAVEQRKKSEESLRKKYIALRYKIRTVIDSRETMKSRLNTALNWAQKLDENRRKMKNSWNDVKELEAIVRHREAQIRGLHARHTEQIASLEANLRQREEAIRSILLERTKVNVPSHKTKESS